MRDQSGWRAELLSSGKGIRRKGQKKTPPTSPSSTNTPSSPPKVYRPPKSLLY